MKPLTFSFLLKTTDVENIHSSEAPLKLFNCAACGNAHNLPACKTLDCTLWWGMLFVVIVKVSTLIQVCCDISFLFFIFLKDVCDVS